MGAPKWRHHLKFVTLLDDIKNSKARIKQQRLLLGGISLSVVVILLLAAWFGRGHLRNWYAEATKPVLPVEQPVSNTSTTGVVVTSTNSGQVATSTQATSTKPGEFPKELNLSVPFVLQAPHQKWVLPYEEACEEASLIMAINAGKKAPTAEQADTMIQEIVAREMEMFGDYFHTSATQTAALAKDFFKVKSTRIFDIRNADDIKRELAAGHPVLIPADGKLLKNPNFKNGGPIYHMLLIKGYLADGRWITNDPGTRLGKDYIYTNEVLMNAIHDWTGEAADGARVGLIVVP